MGAESFAGVSWRWRGVICSQVMDPDSPLTRVRLALGGRGGRIGGVVLVLLGAGLVATGVWGTEWLTAAGIWSAPRGQGLVGGTLALCVVGLGCVALGAGALFGSHARVRTELEAIGERVAQPRADAAGVARQHPLPFWVCSECRVVEAGLSACCMRCGKTVAFVQATDEGERRTAVTALG